MKLKAFTYRCPGGFVLEMPETDLPPGKVCAVIGANGSGKTTLAKAVAGVIRTDQRAAVAETKNIGYMPQNSFAFRMKVRANLLLTGGTAERAEILLDALHLRRYADHPAKRLSAGETARVALARVLMCPHELLVLDEPCAAMDMESALLAEECVTDYARANDCAVMMSTQSLQQARRMADNIMFIYEGRMLEYGSAPEVLTEPRKPETKRFLEFAGVSK